jgi:Leucine-rich repeat (LRR) protein
MNTRFSLITLSISTAVLSLALVTNVAGATPSSVSDDAIGIGADVVTRGVADNHLLSHQDPDISQAEPLTLTEPISIYLPLLSTAGYIDKSAERNALMVLYNSTNGDGWFNDTGWGTDSSHCDWYGVTCSEHEHVTIIDLSFNGLTGTLPPEIGNLPMLTVLRLYGTFYLPCISYGAKGPPPCDLEYYQLRDPLPPEIGNLANLRELDLGLNQFAYLPPEIGNLSNLQVLKVTENPLTSLPPEIGNLANLHTLDLRWSKLTSLPPEIGNLANLQELWLLDNQLSSLPSEIGNLVSLQYLSLGSNQLASLPPEIGNLVSLEYLYLGSNQLPSLPPEIGNLVSLGFLGLSYNKLSGSIPAFLTNLGNLSILYLDGNPDFTCWETEEARDWALSLDGYSGPTCYLP